jgi:putative spermidine/putrescine transport system substrate-binding protein
MKRTALCLHLGLLAAGGCLSGSAASARDLTVVGWGGNTQDAQRQIYFQPFSKASGKPVLEESWDGGIGILQSKVKAGSPNWDVVQVEADELAIGCADGLYEKIDWKKLGSKDAYLKTAVGDCGVGAFVWSTVIAYDSARISGGAVPQSVVPQSVVPESWADFWNTAKLPGKRALRKGAKYTLEFALLADGVPGDKLYDVLAAREGVDRAFRKLDQLRPSLVWWESGAQALQLLASGEVVMTSAYSGRIAGINRTENRKFKVVWPGSIYAVDSWVILKGAENKALGEDFIAFASRSENQVKLPAFVAYGPSNLDAARAVPEDLRGDLPTTPANLEQAIALDVDFWTDNSEALTKRFNAWLAR